MTEPNQQSTHTPGPWKASVDGREPQHWLITDAAGKSGICRPIGYVHEPGVLYLSEAKANARLIAAAPELLDVLRQAASYIESTRGFVAHFAMTDYCGTDRILGRASAVTAKAQGETAT